MREKRADVPVTQLFRILIALSLGLKELVDSNDSVAMAKSPYLQFEQQYKSIRWHMRKNTLNVAGKKQHSTIHFNRTISLKMGFVNICSHDMALFMQCQFIIRLFSRLIRGIRVLYDQ